MDQIVTQPTFASLGAAVRERRDALGLTQDRLAALSGLSRATVNELETGAIKELAFTRLTRVLELVGLGLSLNTEPAPSISNHSALAAVAQSASVSYRLHMPPAELAKALKTGVVAPSFRAHIATLLDEAPVPLIVRAVEEVFNGVVPKATWRYIARWAAELKSTRLIWH